MINISSLAMAGVASKRRSWLGGKFVNAYGLSTQQVRAGFASFVVFLLLFGIILR
ncbi:hypothetical protein ACDI13_06305 [Alcaligenes faecalis]|uniref:hypothetical protein n=1 Tax=Alcaligenes faecalis TaxID=511 RepID=UPI00355846A9